MNDKTGKTYLQPKTIIIILLLVSDELKSLNIELIEGKCSQTVILLLEQEKESEEIKKNSFWNIGICGNRIELKVKSQKLLIQELRIIKKV